MLPLSFLCLILALTTFYAPVYTETAEQVERHVRKQFILSLENEALCDSNCVSNIKELVKQVHIREELAECHTKRFNAGLRMLTVRCEQITSVEDAQFLNKRFNDMPGVKTSAQDSLLSCTPSESKMDAETSKRSRFGMFAPNVALRAELQEGFTPYNWGLDRIDEDVSPLDNQPMDFSCYPKQGENVKVYIIDTGCKIDHNEFTEVSVHNMKAPDSDYPNGEDDHGHGTHIAGVVVGNNVGIARKASVVCIKAFDQNGNGAATDTINAVEFVLEEKSKNSSVPVIVNLSYSALSGFSKTALDELVYTSSARGILFVVSAGNAAINSCLFSPSKAKQAFTVTASTMDDTLETDSNTGPCVEFVAPGHEIVSAGIASRFDYETRNGTSMAVPHIVGLSALVLAERPELQQRPHTVRDTLYDLLISRRSAQVANYTMPLMEIGCESDILMKSAEVTNPEVSAEALISPSTSPIISLTLSLFPPAPEMSESIEPSSTPNEDLIVSQSLSSSSPEQSREPTPLPTSSVSTSTTSGRTESFPRAQANVADKRKRSAGPHKSNSLTSNYHGSNCL